MGLGRLFKRVVNTVAKVASATGIPVISQAGNIIDRIIPDRNTGRPVISATRSPVRQGSPLADLIGPGPPRVDPSNVLRLIGGAAGFATGGVGGAAFGATVGNFVGQGIEAFSPADPRSSFVGLPDVMAAGMKAEATAPRGFYVHTVTPETSRLLGNAQAGTKVAVRKGSTMFKALGMRVQPKPVISVGDSQAIRRADRARTRVKRLAKSVDLYVRDNPPPRTKTTRRR